MCASVLFYPGLTRTAPVDVFNVISGSSAKLEIKDGRSNLSAGGVQTTSAKKRAGIMRGIIFLLYPGLQRFNAGLLFANRVVRVRVWLQNQKEIPDKMNTIRQIM